MVYMPQGRGSLTSGRYFWVARRPRESEPPPLNPNYYTEHEELLESDDDVQVRPANDNVA